MRWLPIIAALAVFLSPLPGHAHEVRPAYLDLSEDRPGEFSVLWKTPMAGTMRLALDPGAQDHQPAMGDEEQAVPARTHRDLAPLLGGEVVLGIDAGGHGHGGSIP